MWYWTVPSTRHVHVPQIQSQCLNVIFIMWLLRGEATKCEMLEVSSRLTYPNMHSPINNSCWNGVMSPYKSLCSCQNLSPVCSMYAVLLVDIVGCVSPTCMQRYKCCNCMSICRCDVIGSDVVRMLYMVYRAVAQSIYERSIPRHQALAPRQYTGDQARIS